MAIPELVPMVLACSEMGVRYHRGRDLALSGRIDLHWVNGRMFVSRPSIEQFKRENAPAVRAPRLRFHPLSVHTLTGGAA